MQELSIKVAWMQSHQTVKIEDRAVSAGITLYDLIELLRKETNFPDSYGISVFGKKRNPQYVLREGDRVEICQPLLDDPLLRRRARVKMQKRKA